MDNFDKFDLVFDWSIVIFFNERLYVGYFWDFIKGGVLGKLINESMILIIWFGYLGEVFYIKCSLKYSFGCEN